MKLIRFAFTALLAATLFATTASTASAFPWPPCALFPNVFGPCPGK